MAVEKMELLGAIGCIGDIDMISEEMVKCGCIHAVNALDEINYYIRDLGDDAKNFITQYEKTYTGTAVKNNIADVMDILEVKVSEYENYTDEDKSINEISSIISPIYKSAVSLRKALEKANGDIESMYELQDNLKDITDIKYPISDVKNLRYFRMGIGRLRRDFYRKLKDNIENIPSIIYRLSIRKKYITIISFTPVSKISETYEIFKSLGYEEVTIPEGVSGVPSEVILGIDELIKEKKETIKHIEEQIKAMKCEWSELVKKCYSLTLMHERMEYLDSGAVNTNHLFYICGWIPRSERRDMESKLEKVEAPLAMTFLERHDVKRLTPPTRLINSKIVRPFEYLVNMYGTPSYGEIDPTSFLALSYMILFGAMFGDAGQGLVLLLGGLFLIFVKKAYSFGGILASVGISSVIFGVFYGSVFGIETIIKPLLIKPISNINTMLIGGILLGAVLLSIGYIFNLINSFKSGELEEGVFGREGAAGFLLFLILFLSAIWVYKYKKLPVSTSAVLIVVVLLLLLIVIKQPLSRLLTGKKPLYDNSAVDYYVESIFGVVETLLSILSNTISFLRIGAFALNHAGLFIAFSTVSAMIAQKTGSIAVMVLGNIIIIGLEGLVVFIQCLRLEYYEIFSKFYDGDGEEYRPVCILKMDDK